MYSYVFFGAALRLPHRCGENNWLKLKVSTYWNAIFLHNNKYRFGPPVFLYYVVII